MTGRRGHRGRTDSNHAAIVEALRAAGWRVQSLTEVGNGCPDLFIWKPFSDLVRLVEIKTPTGRLTEAQSELVTDGCPVRIVRSVEDALALR